MATPEETDDFGRPLFLPIRDRKGNPIPAQYPNGETIAVCNGVVAIHLGGERFAIVHGSETVIGLTREEAEVEFGCRALQGKSLTIRL